MTAFPKPLFDHIVINARDRVNEAEERYRQLGFTLTARGYHTLGSVNHCAVFGTDYLEIVGIEPGQKKIRAEILATPEGLNGIVFATDDANALYETLAAAGAPAEPPGDFSRPVTLPGGVADARFRVVRIKADATPYGRVYFCQHFTPELVWRDAWRSHANGATGLASAVILATEPEKTAVLYRQLFGADAVTPIENGLSLAAGDARLDIVTHAWNETAQGPDRLLGLSVKTKGTPRLVPSNEAFGAVLEFVR